ncbi:MAG: tetratricopeptide repeat protein [Myxococcota bacterium]
MLAGDLPGAERSLAQAAREDPSTVDAYLALASLLRTRGDIGRAIQIHQNLLLRPDLTEEPRQEALLGLALDFRVGGFLQRAAATFEDLLEIDPGNLEALQELERIRVDSGDWEAAIQIRKRIGRGDPRTPNVLAHLWSGLGRAKLQAGRENEGRRAFRRALSQDRGCAEAYLALGDFALQHGKASRALGLWRRTLGLHPAIGLLAYPRLWEGSVATGDLGRLEQLLAERIEESPDDTEAAIWLARVRVRQERVDEGLAVLSQQVARDPTFLGGHAEMGRILLRERRDAEALKTFEELLDRLPLDRSQLRCRHCGTQDTHLHWRCPQCGEWDSFVQGSGSPWI